MRLAAASIAAFSAALTAAGCGGSDTKVGFPAACTTPTYKPAQIVLTCADANTVVRGISWKSYGDKTAEAAARPTSTRATRPAPPGRSSASRPP